MFCAFLAGTVIEGYIEFIFNNAIVGVATEILILGAVFILLFNGHLTMATGISTKKRLGIVTGIYASIVLLVGLFHLSSLKEFDPWPNYSQELKPPLIPLVNSRSIDQFVKNSEKVFDIKITEFNHKSSPFKHGRKPK